MEFIILVVIIVTKVICAVIKFYFAFTFQRGCNCFLVSYIGTLVA